MTLITYNTIFCLCCYVKSVFKIHLERFSNCSRVSKLVQSFRFFLNNLKGSGLNKIQVNNTKSLTCEPVFSTVTLYYMSHKYDCSGASTFKSQRVGYQSNKKLLYHYQHSKNHLNS